jgi:uncharacterized lipoprotein YmbA
MKRLLLVVVPLVIAGCATQSASHYSVVPETKVVERVAKQTPRAAPELGSGGSVR